MNSSKWLHQLATLETDAVLITVLDTKGSVPREAGTKMLVTPTDIQGTIGGGNLEHQCIALATERLSNHEELGWLRDIRRFPLGARLGQCCGGLVIVMLEYITAHDTLAHDSWVKQLNTALTEKRAAVLVTPLAQSENKFLISSEQLNRQLFHKNY